jgi:D-alanyl-D-alanine carboxypeptidase
MRSKILLLSFIFSLPFWWGINLLDKNLNNFFYWKIIADNPEVFAAQIVQRPRNLSPVRNENIADFEIKAKSAISVFTDNKGNEKTLFGKETNQNLPIASVSKLMTFLVVLENYDLAKEITITNEAVAQEEDFGKLEADKVFPTEYLLYPLLMESSNDAAFSLANDYEGMDIDKFVGIMNSTAQKLGLDNTYFASPSGLDPKKDEPQDRVNRSTANDLKNLTEYLLDKPLIWEILSLKEYNAFGPTLINSNALLGEIPDVVGGKTGYTELAGKCMVLVLKAPNNGGYIINVILGTNDKFGEMKKLVEWVNNAYKWQ